MGRSQGAYLGAQATLVVSPSDSFGDHTDESHFHMHSAVVRRILPEICQQRFSREPTLYLSVTDRQTDIQDADEAASGNGSTKNIQSQKRI